MLPGLHVCYPVTNFETFEITPVLVNDHTSFHLTKFNLEEPIDGTPVSPQEIDVVFVPMLICDRHGYRVCFRKGFYDRFLPRCRPDVLKIGFSYFEPVERIDDTHQFDVPLDFCITPSQVLECQTPSR